MLNKTVSSTLSIDGVLTSPVNVTQTGSLDSLLVFGALPDIGAWAAHTYAASSLDGLLVLTKLPSLSLDVYINATSVTTNFLDAALTKTFSATTSLDAQVLRVSTRTPALDAHLIRIGATQTASLDSTIQRGSVSATLSLDARIAGEIHKTASLDAEILTGFTRQLGFDAVTFYQPVFAVAGFDAALQQIAVPHSASFDAILAPPFTRYNPNVSMDVHLFNWRPAVDLVP